MVVSSGSAVALNFFCLASSYPSFKTAQVLNLCKAFSLPVPVVPFVLTLQPTHLQFIVCIANGISRWRWGQRIPLAIQEIWVQSLGREDPLEKAWQPTSVFLPGEFCGHRSLAGCSVWGSSESDTTERLTHTFLMWLSYPL